MEPSRHVADHAVVARSGGHGDAEGQGLRRHAGGHGDAAEVQEVHVVGVAAQVAVEGHGIGEHVGDHIGGAHGRGHQEIRLGRLHGRLGLEPQLLQTVESFETPRLVVLKGETEWNTSLFKGF